MIHTGDDGEQRSTENLDGADHLAVDVRIGRPAGLDDEREHLRTADERLPLKAQRKCQCPSWVGKRAGCKRNLTQSSARTTKIRAQFSEQTTQNRAQFRARMTSLECKLFRANAQNLVTIKRANETRSGHNFLRTNLQAVYAVHRLFENTKTAIIC